MENKEKIKAVKNKQVQYFTRKQWDVMGTYKYGWEIEPEVPKEVKAMVGAGISGVNVKTALPIDNSDADKFKIAPNQVAPEAKVSKHSKK